VEESDDVPGRVTAMDLAVSAPKQRRLRGTVKTYCPVKGRGYIKCGGADSMHRDVAIFADEAAQHNITVGAMITFALKLVEGRSQATDIRVLVQGVQPRPFVTNLVGREIDWKREYLGTIKWFHKETGITESMRKKDPGDGFIECEETFDLFGYDVWVYPRQCAGFNMGDEVYFTVDIDHYWSWPCAHNLRLAKAKEIPQADVMFADGPPRFADGTEATIWGMQAAHAAKQALIDGYSHTSHQANGTSAQLHAGASTAGAQARRPDANWQRFAMPDGAGYWWWNESTEESFLESNPGRWAKYIDPQSSREYWWKDDGAWFWT